MNRTFVSVSAADKPGELGRICQAIANAGVNVDCFTANAGNVRFLTSDNRKTLDAVKKLGLDCKEIDVLEVPLSNRPGELARVAKALGDAGVNIDNSFGCANGPGTASIYLRVNDVKKATPIVERLSHGATTAKATH